MRAVIATLFAAVVVLLPLAYAVAQSAQEPALDHVVSSFAVAAQENGAWEWDVYMADRKTVIRGQSPTFERAVRDVLALMSRRAAKNS